MEIVVKFLLLMLLSSPLIFIVWLLWIIIRLRLGIVKKVLLFTLSISPFLLVLQELLTTSAFFGGFYLDGMMWSLYSLHANLLVMILLSGLALLYIIKQSFKDIGLTILFIVLSAFSFILINGFSNYSYSRDLASFYDSIGNRYLITESSDRYGYLETKILINRLLVDLFVFKFVKFEAGGWSYMSNISMPLNGEEEIFTNYISYNCEVFESDGHLIFKPKVIQGQLKVPLLYNIEQAKVIRPYDIKNLPDFSHLKCLLNRSISYSLGGGQIQP